MKKRLLLTTAAILAFCALAAHKAHSQGIKFIESTPVFQQEGRQTSWFNVSCSSYVWTLVIGYDAASRSTLLQNPIENTVSICLSSSTATGACNSSTQGPELSVNSELTDFTHMAWYCQSYAASSPQNIKGYRTWDKADIGARTDATRQ